MMKSKFNLKFDDSFSGRLFSTQGDTGREFEIVVQDEYDYPIDITGYKLEFYVGNSQQVTKVDGTIVGNKFIVKPVSQQFKFAGQNKAQFVLYDKSGLKVGSQIFELMVEESIQNGATLGMNAIVDFEEIKKATKLIEGYTKTFEESKAINLSLKENIKEGTTLNANLKSTNRKAEFNTGLINEGIKQGGIVKDALDGSIKGGKDLKMNLDASISTATQTKTNIDQSISSAGTSKTNLDGSIDAAKKVKTDLDGSIGTGRTVKSTLDKTIETGQNVNTSGMQIKQGLDDSISKAKIQKSDLDGSLAKVPQNIASINNAINTADERLQATIKTAETKEGELKSTVGNASETDTKAQATMSELKSLLDKSSTSEQALKEIIASGNLDKYVTDPRLQDVLKVYVTDPKLQQVLEGYATKLELQSIDVTKQLTDYAKKKEIPDVSKFKTEQEIKAMIPDVSAFRTESQIKTMIESTTPKVDLSGYAKKTDIGVKVVTMSQAEYDALQKAGTIDENTLYFIME